MSNSKTVTMKLSIVVLLIQIQAVVLESGHHEHSHGMETPHYKYSREANEKQPVHDNHGHSHQHHHHHHEHLEEHRHTHDQYHFDENEHHHAHLSGESDHHHQQHIKSRKESKSNYKPYDPNGILSFMNNFHTRLWVYSIGSTLLISFMPFVILSIIPIQANTAESEPFLKVLLSFGSGGLLGDAFLHLIPHSIPSHQADHRHSHSHSHSHDGSGHSHGPHDMTVGSYVLAGILAFLTVEKLVRILRNKRMIHSHSHDHSSSSSNDKKKIKKRGKSSSASKEKKSDVSSAEESLHNCSDEEHLIENTANHETGFKVAAYLNLAADFAHNFTDGLAIGASFLAGTAVGVVTMITVLIHEIPHEIGDFAILVQSGFTKKKAMSVQLLTALGALTGCILSLCSANADKLSDSASSSWILPFTAGGFIYIATVTVIPELLENSSTWQTIKEIVALLTGIILIPRLLKSKMNAFLNRPKKQNNASTTLMEIPWVEKYRPRKVEEVAFQNEVVSVLKKVLSGADLPNLLFYGPPGTGKTSAAIALCRQLFRNAETYHDRVMEMNASDERGINIVRSKIKEFARRAVSSHLPDGSPVVGLKVIILDEADAMTTPAQAALRRTMERESRTTRFFLICNYITRIIDPLTSRCAKFRFKSISSESQRERLEWICQNENVEFDPLAINELIELCDGDMRKSVTALQTISSCHKKLVPDDVRQFLGSVPDDVVEQFLAACKSLDHNQLYACVESIRREGYGVYQLLKQFFYVYLHLEDLSDLNKAAICEKIGLSFLFFFSSFVCYDSNILWNNLHVCEMRILDGANEFLQLLDFGTVVMEQFKMSL